MNPRPRVGPVGSLTQLAQHRVPLHICGRLNVFRVSELGLKELIDRCLVLANLVLLCLHCGEALVQHILQEIDSLLR